MTLPKLLAFGVFAASLAALVVVWSLFFTMWLHGETSITLVFNRYGEFWTEFRSTCSPQSACRGSSTRLRRTSATDQRFPDAR